MLWTRDRLAKPAGVRIVYCSGDARENMIWSSCQIKMVCSYSIPCHVSWGCFYISIPFVSYMHPIIRCLYEQDNCHHALHITQNQIENLKVMALSVCVGHSECAGIDLAVTVAFCISMNQIYVWMGHVVMLMRFEVPTF